MGDGSGQAPTDRRELLLMRHAKSSWGTPGLPDAERGLTSRGRRDATRMGNWLAGSDRMPDHVVCSTALRARGTVERVVDALGIDLDDVRWEERIYEAMPADLLGVLAATPGGAQRVLLIGHNPGLEILVERLARGSVVMPPDGKFFPTAAVAHLAFEGRWDALLPGSCELVEIARPRHLDEDG
jgi:phosphohistidine phosphatase